MEVYSKCRFEELRVYQDAIAWISSIYTVSRHWPKDETFGLTSQWRRAATSAALNIAEGSARGTKEFCRFLEIARASCFESGNSHNCQESGLFNRGEFRVSVQPVRQVGAPNQRTQDVFRKNS